MSNIVIRNKDIAILANFNLSEIQNAWYVERGQSLLNLLGIKAKDSPWDAVLMGSVVSTVASNVITNLL